MCLCVFAFRTRLNIQRREHRYLPSMSWNVRYINDLCMLREIKQRRQSCVMFTRPSLILRFYKLEKNEEKTKKRKNQKANQPKSKKHKSKIKGNKKNKKKSKNKKNGKNGWKKKTKTKKKEKKGKKKDKKGKQKEKQCKHSGNTTSLCVFHI